jgi:hypothetical protein
MFKDLQESISMRYIIAAPSYNGKSAGIRVLYELQKWLVRFGKDAMILNWNAPYPVNEDDVVVYPEIISGNPLKGKRVVRYILNEPGKLGGDKEYGGEDILVAYDEGLAQFVRNPDDILRMPCVEDFFTNTHCERTIDCYWVGKGEFSPHHAVQHAVEINYQWPWRRRELAALLNRTRTLYSYDHRTALILEAALCGCEIKEVRGGQIVTIGPMVPFDLDSFPAQLNHFIEMTWYPEMDAGREAAGYVDSVIARHLAAMAPQ